jgi:hypothetical protein
MPWVGLPYALREFKDDLDRLYDVDGIPALILLTGAGEEITRDGRYAIERGIHYFPWGKEQMAAANEADELELKVITNAAKNEEEAVTETIEDKGWLAMRRIRGTPMGSTINAEQVITFNEFDTFGCGDIPIAMGKIFYEVEIEEFSGEMGQIGWADVGFDTTIEIGDGGDGMAEIFGVGDCNHSWGVDGVRKLACHGENAKTTEFGGRWKKGDVLGLAADCGAKTISFGLNGVWDGKMGVAFKNIRFNGGLYPALSAASGVFKCNLGGVEFKFGPPDAT